MKDISKISSIKEKKADYDDAPEDLKGTGKMEETIGTCKFCKQTRAVRIFPGEDPDKTATDECDCTEAKAEHKVSISIRATSNAIDKKFPELKPVPAAEKAIKAALEPVARGMLDSATFKIGGFTFIVTEKDNRLCCIKKYTSVDMADENGEA